MPIDDYWVGIRKDTGSIWVYDPFLKNKDSEKVYAYSVERDQVREYPKSQIKGVLVTLEDSRRDVAIQSYLKWFEKYGNSFVKEHEKLKILDADKRQNQIIERHKQYLVQHGKRYLGITKSSAKKHRVTHCYSCKVRLDSSLHIECNACNWLICSCGACGCGYEKWY